MKINLTVLTVLFLSTFAFSQDCGTVIYDGANILRKNPALDGSVSKLIDKGADVRVWTVPANPNLDAVEKQAETKCQSWQAPNGDRKSTLVVLMVSPSGSGYKGHIGMYYGAAWHKAFDEHWNRIKQESMLPHFQQADFSGGFAAAANQLAARITASQDEALHPAVSTTVNEAQDLSGLWKFLAWLLAVFVCITGIVLVFKWLSRRQQAREVRITAQRTAIARRDRVVSFLDSVKTNDKYAPFAEEYSRIAGSLSNDPTQDDLSAGQYVSIANVYTDLSNRMMSYNDLSNATPAKYQAPAQTKHTKHTTPKPTQHEQASQPAPATREVVRETTVVHDNSNDFTTGVVLGSVLSHTDDGYRERERERERQEEREDERRREESRREESHSSWSSSSSDSSSGGSSDFGGGGSDFGGGGSSDFGGGGDSGGGGSSDF